MSTKAGSQKQAYRGIILNDNNNRAGLVIAAQQFDNFNRSQALRYTQVWPSDKSTVIPAWIAVTHDCMYAVAECHG